MQGQWWKHVNEYRCEFVQAMEDQTVLPDHDRHHQHPHAHHVVGLEPHQAVREQNCLTQNRNIHEVTKVQQK